MGFFKRHASNWRSAPKGVRRFTAAFVIASALTVFIAAGIAIAQNAQTPSGYESLPAAITFVEEFEEAPYQYRVNHAHNQTARTLKLRSRCDTGQEKTYKWAAWRQVGGSDSDWQVFTGAPDVTRSFDAMAQAERNAGRTWQFATGFACLGLSSLAVGADILGIVSYLNSENFGMDATYSSSNVLTTGVPCTRLFNGRSYTPGTCAIYFDGYAEIRISAPPVAPVFSTTGADVPFNIGNNVGGDLDFERGSTSVSMHIRAGEGGGTPDSYAVGFFTGQDAFETLSIVPHNTSHGSGQVITLEGLQERTAYSFAIYPKARPVVLTVSEE